MYSFTWWNQDPRTSGPPPLPRHLTEQDKDWLDKIKEFPSFSHKEFVLKYTWVIAKKGTRLGHLLPPCRALLMDFSFCRNHLGLKSLKASCWELGFYWRFLCQIDFSKTNLQPDPCKEKVDTKDVSQSTKQWSITNTLVRRRFSSLGRCLASPWPP